MTSSLKTDPRSVVKIYATKIIDSICCVLLPVNRLRTVIFFKNIIYIVPNLILIMPTEPYFSFKRQSKISKNKSH